MLLVLDAARRRGRVGGVPKGPGGPASLLRGQAGQGLPRPGTGSNRRAAAHARHCRPGAGGSRADQDARRLTLATLAALAAAPTAAGVAAAATAATKPRLAGRAGARVAGIATARTGCGGFLAIKLRLICAAGAACYPEG